jgi:hypothetical protein
MRIVSECLRLLFINVYMPYDGDYCMTHDFADQLNDVESLTESLIIMILLAVILKLISQELGRTRQC